MHKVRCAFHSVIVLTFLLVAPHLQGNSITPGQSGILPDSFPNLGSTASAIADSGALAYSFDGGNIHGLYESYVAVDAANVYCSGCLDFGFIFTVDSNSTYSIQQAAMAEFMGTLTDAGYDSVGFGGTDPTSQSRTLNGSAIFFTVPISPGGQSALLVVETNATAYTLTNPAAGLLDSNSVLGTFSAYSPVATPEPAAGALVGLGFLVLAALRRKASAHKPATTA